ncbi:hypothetical protein PLICRDRAFT_91349 [Plicaturopsis crispa FD-325 SS-3]|nr:hypothetical protein PLICRDRAFT_91349 [Plicaturopsis crispa FD-325 SS-3]
MSLAISLSSNRGFHTSFTSRILVNEPSWLQNCSLHLLFDLPPLLFVDPYELALRAAQYSFSLHGSTNLELPVSAVDPNGSSVLLSLATPLGNTPLNVTVDLPLHARYGEPAPDDASGYYTVDVPVPTVLGACRASDPTPYNHSLLVTPDNLLAFFNQSSLALTTVVDSTNVSALSFSTPIGHAGDASSVESVTVLAILVSFAWVMRTAQVVARRVSLYPPHTKAE